MPIEARRYLFLSLLVALFAGLAFIPGLPGEFVFDDIPNITTNEAVHLKELSPAALSRVLATPQLSGTLRAIPTLSFAVDYWRGDGPDPKVFKTTNIVIHALTALALAWFLRSLLLAAGVSAVRTRWLAPALALAWALHPLQVSAVLYVVQRIQTMGTLFVVLALWAYLQARRAQIDGRPGRTGMLLAGLLAALAMGCKEDSALLPAYTLVLELTVLRFAAADARLATFLRRGYLALVLAGAAAYFFVVIPHFWQWEAYTGRIFSTPERLLTQPRMLCMYLWQILLPLPQHMPFYYDWVQPSRSLLQPWSTLPAIAVVLALLATAWWQRARRPLFSLGVLLFFSAHFIASNVPNLELAFEHRNHFALIGVLLAAGSLLGEAASRLRLGTPALAAACVAALLALGSATLVRAHTWGTTLDIARNATEHAPHSGRAWTQLCASHFAAGGGHTADNTRLDEAIDACTTGAKAAPRTTGSLALLVVLKSLRGDVTAQDWARLHQKLETVEMTRDNARSYMVLTYHARNGVELDRQSLLRTLEILAQRESVGAFGLAAMGYFVMNDFDDPERAIPFFSQAILESSPADPFPAHLAAELRARGEPELAERIEQVGRSRQSAVSAH